MLRTGQSAFVPAGLKSPRPQIWGGLRVDDGRIWLAPVRYVPGRPRLRFDPEGIVVVRGAKATLLPWDEGFPRAASSGAWAWWLVDQPDGVHRLVVVRDRMQLALPAHDGFGYTGEATKWKITPRYGLRTVGREMIGLDTFAIVEAIALSEYLARTPESRDGLGDPARVQQLWTELQTAGYQVAPTGEMLGTAADLDYAITRVLDEAWPRRFCGYGVAGEPAPERKDLLDRIDIVLPAWLRARTDSGMIERRLGVLAPDHRWPFSVLG